MTWTGQTFVINQELTSAQMNNLQADITALANGDAGAPEIVAAGISAGVIGVTELNIASTENSLSILFSETGYVTINSQYLLGFHIRATSTDIRFVGLGRDALGASDVLPHAAFVNDAGSGSETAFATNYYLQGSPPYDMGDGEVPLFIYAQIDNNTGQILRASVSEDPPWNTRAADVKIILDSEKDLLRGSFQERKNIAGVSLKHSIETGNARRYIQDFAKAETIFIPVNPASKNDAMDENPHPFKGHDQAESSIILLDPFAAPMLDLVEFRKHDEASICELLHSGVFKIDNVKTDRKGPRGLPIHSFNWK